MFKLDVMKNYVLLFSFSLYLSFVSSQGPTNHSADEIIHSPKSIQNKVNELNKLSRFYIYYLPQNSSTYSKQALQLALESNYLDGVAQSYLNLGYYSFRVDNYLASEAYYDSAINYFEKANNQIGLGSCYRLMARTSNGRGNYEHSMNLLLKAKTIFEKENFSIGIGRVYETIGDINDIFGDYNSALENLTNSVQIKEENKDFLELSRSYAYLGNVYNHLGNFDEARKNFNEALRLSKVTFNLNAESYVLTKLGDFYFNLKDYDQSIDNYMKSLEITKLHSNTWGKIRNQQGIGNNFYLKKDYSDAIRFLKNSVQSAYTINDKEGLMNSYELISKVYQEWDSIEKSFKYFKLYSHYKDSLYNRKKVSNISMLQNKYDQQIILKEKKTSDVVNYLISGILFLALVLSFLLLRRLKFIREQKQLVEKQKQLVEQKNNEITDSISYAKKIQEAVLTSKEFISSHLPNNFIYYNPKELVSGDFYWMHVKENFIYFSVIDCTGHGVPGALMSMIGNSLLNEMIVEKGLIKTNKILDAVSEKLKSSFSSLNGENSQRDGMDMILCRLNISNNELMYSGAHNSMVIASEGKLHEYKGDRRPVGFYLGKGILFSSKIIQLKKKDVIYLYTDGFADQFGGDRNRKYKNSNFKNFLLEISSQEIEQQGKLVEKEFLNWKGDNEQLDDVCVMGVRV